MPREVDKKGWGREVHRLPLRATFVLKYLRKEAEVGPNGRSAPNEGVNIHPPPLVWLVSTCLSVPPCIYLNTYIAFKKQKRYPRIFTTRYLLVFVIPCLTCSKTGSPNCSLHCSRTSLMIIFSLPTTGITFWDSGSYYDRYSVCHKCEIDVLITS